MATALVTGATAGIGLSIARQLAGHGHDIVLVARDQTRLAEVAGDIARQFRVQTEVLACDLTDEAALPAVEARLADPARPVEWLVNNAGFGVKEPFDASSIEAETAMLDVLVRAPLRLTHAALPGMLARGRGRILIVASMAAFLPMGTYSAAKAWTTTFAEGLNTAYRDQGVHTTALCPGFTHTEFHERADMDVSQIPSRLWQDADDVAAAGIKACAEGRPIAIAGATYRGLHLLTSVLPRPLVRRVGAVRKR